MVPRAVLLVRRVLTLRLKDSLTLRSAKLAWPVLTARKGHQAAQTVLPALTAQLLDPAAVRSALLVTIRR